jgi:hypothetical protein
MTTARGAEYPDPLFQVWHLVPPGTRKRIERLAQGDAIRVRIPFQMVPALIQNASIRHGL